MNEPETSSALIDECAREPIHIPGSVQPHGMLFVLDTGSFTIRQASANTSALIGRNAAELIGSDFLSLVPEDARPMVTRLVTEAAVTYVNPFRVPVSTANGPVFFDGIVHLLEDGGTVIELESDPAGGEPDIEGLENYLQIIHRSLDRVRGLTETHQIADVMAREVKRFTGFDRVMVYRFAPDFHGEVIAEAKEPEMEPYLHLHYPASDIPPQARALYLRNPVRLLQNVDAVPSPLEPVLNPQTGKPLDMSRSVLRSMSPIHVQYLKNMGVSASLSISLVVDGVLWGLIACHHRTPRFVSYSVRATASLYTMVMSAQLRLKQSNLLNLEISAARRLALDLITGLRDFTDPVRSLEDALPGLASLFHADGAALLGGGIHSAGSVPDESILLALQQDLEEKRGNGVRITHQAAFEFPSLSLALPKAAGMVAVHLGERAWLVLFRDEAVINVDWAGDPAHRKERGSDGTLRPRHSFATWRETVGGQSASWPESTPTLATEIRSGFLELVAKRNIQLERSNQDLRRFAGIVAHEVKNQVQAGILVMALLREHFSQEGESPLAPLVASADGSLQQLIGFTDDMLRFSAMDTSSEIEDIDFAALARDVVDQLDHGGKTGGAGIEIHSLPRILAPRLQIHHVLSNLIRNALIHARTDERSLRIEIGHLVDERDGLVIYVRDNGRGIPGHMKDRIFDYFYSARQDGRQGTGIGLAFCAQALQRLGHRMWVESEPQEGSTFYFSVSPAG